MIEDILDQKEVEEFKELLLLLKKDNYLLYTPNEEEKDYRNKINNYFFKIKGITPEEYNKKIEESNNQIIDYFKIFLKSVDKVFKKENLNLLVTEKNSKEINNLIESKIQKYLLVEDEIKSIITNDLYTYELEFNDPEYYLKDFEDYGLVLKRTGLYTELADIAIDNIVNDLLEIKRTRIENSDWKFERILNQYLGSEIHKLKPKKETNDTKIYSNKHIKKLFKKGYEINQEYPVRITQNTSDTMNHWSNELDYVYDLKEGIKGRFYSTHWQTLRRMTDRFFHEWELEYLEKPLNYIIDKGDSPWQLLLNK